MEDPVDIVAALEARAEDPVAEAKIRALKALQTKKVRTLMSSIEKLKDEVDSLRRGQMAHRQNAQLRQTKERLREQELVVDVLKEELRRERNENDKPTSDYDMNEWVIQRTVGGPKRFRPKTREELQNEVEDLTKEKMKLTSRVNRQKKAGRTTGSGFGSSMGSTKGRTQQRGGDEPVEPGQSSKRAAASTSTGWDDSGLPTLTSQDMDPADIVRERSDILQRLEDLTVELRTQEGLADSLAKETRTLRTENRDLRRAKDAAKRQENVIEALRLRLSERDTELERAGMQLMAKEEEAIVARSEVEESEIAHTRVVQQLRDELTLAAEELSQMEMREVELENELERLKVLGSSERQSQARRSSEIRSAAGTLAARLRQVERERDRLALHTQRQTERIGDLERQASHLEHLRGQLRASNQEKKEAMRRFKDMERLYNDSMVAKATEAEASRNQHQQLEKNAKIKTLEKAEVLGEMRAWRQKASRLADQVHDLERELEAERAAHSSTVAALEAEQAMLSDARMLHDQEGTKRLREVQKLQANVDEVTAERAALEDKVEILREKLEASEKSLHAAEAEYEETKDKARLLQKQVLAAKQLRHREQSIIEETTADLEDAQKTAEKASHEAEKLRVELRLASGEIEERSKSLQDMSAEIERANRQLQEAKRDAADAAAIADETTKDAEEREHKLKGDFGKKLGDYKKQVEDLEAEIESQQKLIREQDGAIAELDTKVAEALGVAEQTEKDYELRAKKTAEAQGELEGRLAELEAEGDDLKAELAGANAEREELKKKVAELEAAADSMPVATPLRGR
uniref:Uncharacterized protein n=1 Tax=Phaeomonas parva TaxID=124430 RepID=A0A7S1UEG2_9STRA